MQCEALVLSSDSWERGLDWRQTGYDRHRCVQGSGIVLRDPARGRADRREMGLPDPARSAQRPPAFRGIPGRARDCAQHPVGSARPARRRRNPQRSPDPTDRRKVIYSLTAKGEGLLPVVLALRQWGEEWGHGSAESRACRPPRRQAGAQDLRPVRTTGAGSRSMERHGSGPASLPGRSGRRQAR